MKLVSIGIFRGAFERKFGHRPKFSEVKLMVASAGPRAVESRTEQTLIRDYSAAWKSLADASETSSPTLLNAYFTGGAKTILSRELADQQKTGTHVRYLNQTHNLKAVFYSPEGDVMPVTGFRGVSNANRGVTKK